MFKLSFVLAAVLLCSVIVTAQVKPNSEIGRVTVQVPLLVNGKPVITQDKVDDVTEEVARVVEVKPGKVSTTEQVVVPPTVSKPVAKVRKMRAIVETVNPGVPNPGKPNPGIPNRGLPNPGVPNPGMPNAGVPNPGMPNPGIPNRGLPNPGVPNPGMPNLGKPNPGVPHVAASEVQPVVVQAPVTTTTPVEMPKTVATRNCFQLLLGDMTTTPHPMPMPPTEPENCDAVCTKFELLPICATNGVCIHEFPNQCIMDSFNCKHRDSAFREVDEQVCRRGLCARRCTPEDINM
ncbi:uncharacterized protein LOC133844154 [Drosophila sulfurigaster albostrigata]|uniref:uncharacterized protein LOC133844154 n=1 Tax=Drosophila sulfurigaster albostrigata TaxID=89887 RepID=UPI002D21E905|nr:uncharacterized protein LOC133844154 [Drosophila sulfurigaster albostrigata]